MNISAKINGTEIYTAYWEEGYPCWNLTYSCRPETCCGVLARDKTIVPNTAHGTREVCLKKNTSHYRDPKTGGLYTFRCGSWFDAPHASGSLYLKNGLSMIFGLFL